jgi:hypothetical protein
MIGLLPQDTEPIDDSKIIVAAVDPPAAVRKPDTAVEGHDG